MGRLATRGSAVSARPFRWIAMLLALAVPGTGLLLGAGGDDFVDTVDVQLSGRETVEGTLRPADERETFPVFLPRGAKLKATAKRIGSDAPELSVAVYDPAEMLLATSAAAKAAKTPRVVTMESGWHRVRICGDGVLDGDYRLKVKAKMPKRASAASAADLAPAAEATFTFGAAEGSVATISVSAPKGSALVPVITRIDGPGGFSPAVPPPTEAGARKHAVRGLALPETGDYVVTIRNDGAAAGAWSAHAKLVPPQAPKATISITDDDLEGEFGGEQAVFARNIDGIGGAVTPTGDAGDLLGVSVDVPAGAVNEPTLFTVAEADPFFVDDDLHEGGATFELGPSGIAFQEDVSVTVPFDPQSFDDPGSEVQIAVRDGATGDVQVVTGTVDVVAGTVTFQTPHFSGFQPVSPRPRPLKGSFVEMQIGGSIDPAFGGTFRLGTSSVTGEKGPRTGNVVRRDRDVWSVSFVPDGKGGALFDATRDQSRDIGSAQADSDLVITFGKNPLSFRRGRSSDVLVRSDGQSGRGTISVLLRRVKGRPTRGALRGDWHGFVVELGVAQGPGGGLLLATAGQRFELSVGPLGRADVRSADMSVTRVPYPSGAPTTERVKKRPKSGELTPAGQLARLTLDVGAMPGAPSIDLYPVVRGDVLVGTTGAFTADLQAPTAGVARLVILVRAGERGDDARLDGRSQLVSVGAGFDAPATAAQVLPTFEVLGLDVVHDGAGSLRATGGAVRIHHDASGRFTVDASPVDETGRYSIDKDLRYRESFPLARGAVARRGGLYVTTDFGEGRMAIGIGVPSRPLLVK